MLEKTRSRSKHRIEKPNARVRDEQHLKEIRSLPCCNCYSQEVIQAAHVRLGSNAGMGKKPDDSRVVPLCHVCHQRQHQRGEIFFWGQRLPKAIDLCAALYGATKDDQEILVYQFYRSGK